MLKPIILGYLAAVWAISHISLLSCTPATCILPAPSRTLIPEFLLRISDYLSLHSFIDIKLLHLIGQLSVLADVIIVVYYILSTVFHVTKTIICNLVTVGVVLVVLGLGIAIHEYGTGVVMQWVLENGVEGVKKVGRVLVKAKGEI